MHEEVLAENYTVDQSKVFIRIEEVNLYYGSFQALRNISFDIWKG